MYSKRFYYNSKNAIILKKYLFFNALNLLILKNAPPVQKLLCVNAYEIEGGNEVFGNQKRQNCIFWKQLHFGDNYVMLSNGYTCTFFFTRLYFE
jgi:hypothetical protein